MEPPPLLEFTVLEGERPVQLSNQREKSAADGVPSQYTWCHTWWLPKGDLPAAAVLRALVDTIPIFVNGFLEGAFMGRTGALINEL